MDIPVKLNYLQVADEVTPGPANAVATITLAYKVMKMKKRLFVLAALASTLTCSGPG